MKTFVEFLKQLSYSRSGLMKSCGIILSTGVLAAGVVAWVFGGEREALWAEEAGDARDELERLYDHWYWEVEEWTGGWAEEPEGELSPYLIWGRQVLAGEAEAVAELMRRTGEETPQEAGVYFVRALYEMQRGNYREAAEAAAREDGVAPHGVAKFLRVDALYRAGAYEELLALAEVPGYAEEIRGGRMVDIAFQVGDWGRMFRHMLIAEYEGLQVSFLVLALLTGGIWAAVLLHCAPAGTFGRIGVWVPAALVLGWMSTWPTVMSYIWMEERLGLVETEGDFLSALLFHVLSVGLREEFFKLLLFSPLLLVVGRMPGRGELEALMLGAMTGLGFAVEENLGYFSGGLAGGITASRFVSATLLHAMLTGTGALALHRAVRDPGRWLADSVTVCAMVVGLHGLYNALLSAPVPGLGDLSYFYAAALAGAVHLFFRELRVYGGARNRAVSVTGLFFWGYSLLVCLETGVSALFYPWSEAVAMVGETAISGVLVAFVFLHQIQEPLGD